MLEALCRIRRSHPALRNNRAAGRAVGILVGLGLIVGASPALAFNVSGFEFPDPDRSLAQRPQHIGEEISYDDVVTSYDHARDAVISTQRSFSAVELLGQTLTGEALAMFEQIPQDRRASYDQAMTAMLESYAQIRAKSQDLDRRMARVTGELRALQSQIFQVEGAQHRLRGEIAALHQSAAELRDEEQRLAVELPAVSACETFARDLALALDRELAAARSEYWTEIGRYFKARDLGSPVDYALPLRPLPARTERRIEVRDEGVKSPAAVGTGTTPGPAAVVATWGRTFPAPVAAQATAAPAPPSDNEAGFRRRLDQCVAAQQACNRLAAAADTALIESEHARRELQEHLAAERAAEQERTIVTDAVESLRTKVGWQTWELQQRTHGARDWLSQCVDKAVEKGRWDALKSILKNSLQNPVAARSMYAHLHLANEVTKTISQGAGAVQHSDDPGLQADRDRLMSITTPAGKEVVREAWGVKKRPLAEQATLEKLLGSEELNKD